MEDGPEAAEGNYTYEGTAHRLVERESEKWSVYDAGVHIGTVAAVNPPDGERGPFYSIRLAADPSYVDESTDDWGRAIETLIDQARIG